MLLTQHPEWAWGVTVPLITILLSLIPGCSQRSAWPQLIWPSFFFFNIIYCSVSCLLSFSHSGLLAVLWTHQAYIPASGFLHVAFPLPELFYPNILISKYLSLSSGLLQILSQQDDLIRSFNLLSWYFLTSFLALFFSLTLLKFHIFYLFIFSSPLSPIRM